MITVLDTNILVSGATYVGNESRVVDYVGDGRFELYVCPTILDEYSRAMARRFHWTLDQISGSISKLLSVATLIYPPPVATGVTGHVPDDLILDCVAAANADFLVTGDRQHLLPLHTYANARIVTATEFIEELERADAQDGYSTR